MKKLLLIFVIVLPFFALQVWAQQEQVIASAGSQFNAGDIILEWTLGEPVIVTLESGNTMISQGFQQPRLIVTAIRGDDVPAIGISAYPNPTTDVLTIELGNTRFPNFSYLLYDMNCLVLEQGQFLSDMTVIDMSVYPPGSYLLKVLNLEDEVQVFKIVKH